MMTSSILFVDDERMMTEIYIKALKRHRFNVEHCATVDCAIEKVINDRSPFSLLVLDVMMPPGNFFTSEETLEGLLTGVFLFRKLRAERPNLPVIVLTNVTNQDTLNCFHTQSNVEVIHKTECPPFDLVQRIQQMQL